MSSKITVKPHVSESVTITIKNVGPQGAQGPVSELTAADIKTLYEVNADTNVFTDSDQTKLGTIEDGATQDQTNSEIKAAYEANADTNVFTDSEKTKLGIVESGATADQTNIEIKTAYESNANTNAFTDAEKTIVGNTSNINTGDQGASEVSIIDVGDHYTATEVENALQEVAVMAKGEVVSVGTDYTTHRTRNIKFMTTDPVASDFTGNGDIIFVYEV